MMDKSFIKFLKLVKQMKKDDFENLVDYLDDKSVDHICECVYNVINTDLNMQRQKVVSLKHHIKKNMNTKRLKMISNKKVPLLKRRRAIKQEGRGLPFLLASAIPFLANLFTSK